MVLGGPRAWGLGFDLAYLVGMDRIITSDEIRNV